MRSDIERLYDILNSIEDIERYSNPNLFDGLLNEKDQVWFLYHIQIIGEASANLSEQFKDRYSEVAWHKIIAMRNYLVHEYLGIDMTMIKDTIFKIIPNFKLKIQQIIDDLLK